MAEENTQIRRPVLRDYSPTDSNPLPIDIGQSFVNQSSVDPVVEQQPIAYSQSHGGGNSTEAKSYPPFQPFLKGTGTGHEIAVRTGYVVEHVVVGDNSIRYHLPTGVPATNDVAPIWKAITVGQCLYVQCQISETGEIEGVPTLIVGSSDLEGEHYRPEVFDFAGNAGISYYKLCQLISAPTGAGVVIKQFNAGSNIHHYDERVGMENLESPQNVDAGSIYRVGKNYDETSDKVQLRTLMQLDGEGEPVIKEDEEGAPPSDSIRFRRIVDLGTDAEVHVLDQDGAILVRGNSYDESVSDAHKVSITVKDGLVTDLSKIDTTGWWGVILHQFFTTIGQSTPYSQLELTYEAGILTKVRNQGGPASPLADVPGTENAQGSAVHATFSSNI